MSSTTDRVDRSTLTGRDYIETLDWSVEEMEEVLAVAGELKEARRRAGRTGCSPTRRCTCCSSTSRRARATPSRPGMTQLGGHAIFLDADKTQVSHGESPKDTAR